MNTRFQYKVETVKTSIWNANISKHDGNIQDRLARLGLEGWELVSVVPNAQYRQLFLKKPS